MVSELLAIRPSTSSRATPMPRPCGTTARRIARRSPRPPALTSQIQPPGVAKSRPKSQSRPVRPASIRWPCGWTRSLLAASGRRAGAKSYDRPSSKGSVRSRTPSAPPCTGKRQSRCRASRMDRANRLVGWRMSTSVGSSYPVSIRITSALIESIPSPERGDPLVSVGRRSRSRRSRTPRSAERRHPETRDGRWPGVDRCALYAAGTRERSRGLGRPCR
jgi:hypothetical protein